MSVKQPKYYLNEKDEFVIENYNYAKPFSNFFPGIAGIYGIPMWTFYVNRGQAIASFGTKDKDHAILEFFPADKSYQLTPSNGFRTFIKVLGKKQAIYEPFHNGFVNAGFKLKNEMRITPEGLTLEEENFTLGLKVRVEYFNIPQDTFAGLARVVTVKNTGRANKKIQLLDGLPQIIPYGFNNFFLKELSRTISAWVNVENLKNSAPFYRLTVDPSDRPEVIHLTAGNFYLGFTHQKNKTKLIKPVVDPLKIFGQNTDFSLPVEFVNCVKFNAPLNESLTSKIPCAFSLVNLNLAGGAESTFNSVIGFMRNIETLNSSISKITAPGYLAKKKTENIKVIEDLTRNAGTKSSSREFDLYTKQTYLDNILRGGFPVVYKDAGKESVFYLYSRKHGDLERDYNKFLVQPTYLSQGNGNYRDMNQNRRSDIWFNPEIKEKNVITFLNLIQSDGFNPLVIKGSLFTLKDPAKLQELMTGIIEPKDIRALSEFLNKPFTPGDAILFLEDNSIKVKGGYDKFLNILMTNSVNQEEAEHGEGFWTDHWTYNLDLLNSYFAVWPEKLKETIFDNRVFTFFDNFETVRPRSEKYVLYNGKPLQLHSVAPDHAKRELIHQRTLNPHLARADYGQGEIYRTTLINKLICLFANKMASLDANGCGIEMEANKPNWYDALNGLPALFGSSICETFELKRLVVFIKDALKNAGIAQVEINEELYEFTCALGEILDISDDFEYWDKSAGLKEEYRSRTKMGFSGKEVAMGADKLNALLDKALAKLAQATDKAHDKKNNVYYSYFINEVVDFDLVKGNYIRPKKFKQIKVPLFLAGQMHALRMSEDNSEAAKIHQGTKKSGLFDKKLKMYKVTASLKSMPEEIGRCRVFAPGWLEHESIWLHMEYKYLLELLKRGLYKEFFEDFRNTLVPFQNAARYGRSILENSSFIVSSAFEDKSLHGNGFVARLSGSTAEFMEIWLTMNAGKNPFFIGKDKELNLKFSPILPGWLFDRKGDYSFMFLGEIPVTYHNAKRLDTFGAKGAKISKIVIDGQDLNSGIIPSPYAKDIRSRQAKNIDIYLD
ncbi:MAG: cellobiose phosphorylase [Candidatus Omnitrophica bacterium]|nr:cellobiose phosphorylase [Candidatus Omnitrophota bacterium]